MIVLYQVVRDLSTPNGLFFNNNFKNLFIVGIQSAIESPDEADDRTNPNDFFCVDESYDDVHCVSFGCVVVFHIPIILILSSFVNPKRHLKWEFSQSSCKSLLSKDLCLVRPPRLYLSTYIATPYVDVPCLYAAHRRLVRLVHSQYTMTILVRA